MIFDRKGTKRSMRLNSYLMQALISGMEGYVELLEGIDDGELDDLDASIALGRAEHASTTLRDVSPHAERMVDTLPPALLPLRAMEILQAIGESALIMLAFGPDHELVLTQEQLDEMITEPFTVHWIQLQLDGPKSQQDLADERPQRPSRPATGAEQKAVTEAAGPLVAKLTDRYRALHDDRPLAAEAIAEAVELAIETAIVLRGAHSNGRSRTSYPPELLYLTMAVLAPVMQSLVVLATPTHTDDPASTLHPDDLAELLAAPLMPAL